MSRQNIFNMIDSEREYQDSKWGQDFDERNTVNDWTTFINRYASRASEAESSEEFEIAMVKVAALAVAAIETCRRDGIAPRHYDIPVVEATDEALAELFGLTEGLTFDQLPEIEGLSLRDISTEEVRVYETAGIGEYRISNPVGVYLREGGTTHRIVDSQGICHCIAFPNEGRTVLRWQNKDLTVPCNW